MVSKIMGRKGMRGHPPPNKGKGKGILWLQEHLNYSGDDCLPWPFSGTEKGYGCISFQGRLHKASRLMCELAHRAPPEQHYQAAHSCGNGHEGCVNPRHLSWKTRSENQRDSISHGTARKPGDRPKFKLTPEQVAVIRTLEGKKTQIEIGRMFGVNPEIISKIFNGKAWRTGGYDYGGFTDPNHPVHQARRAALVSNAKSEESQ